MGKMIEGKCPMFDTCAVKLPCVGFIYQMSPAIGIDISKN